VSHFKSVSKTISIPKDLGRLCVWRTCHYRRGILDTPRKFHRKILGSAGFISGVMTFHSSLIVTLTWLHCSIPLGLNVNVSSFPLMLSFMILAATSIATPAVLKNERYLMTDIHINYHEVHRYERIPDSHRDIFGNSHWTPDQLIRQLQMHGSRDQGIMIQLIADYIWHDAHACSKITESFIKHLGANQISDSWNT
jgi:hypothetical protein